MAAVLMTDNIYQVIADNTQKNIMFGSGFTASAHPVACAVALENIRVIEENKLMDRVPKLQGKFQERLNMLEDIDIVGEARGIGLMGAVEVVHDHQETVIFRSDQVGGRYPDFVEVDGRRIRNPPALLLVQLGARNALCVRGDE